MLIDRAGFSLEEENSIIAKLQMSIAGRLPHIFGSERSGLLKTNLSLPAELTWAVRSEIGLWIRRGVAGHYRKPGRYVLLPNFCISFLDSRPFQEI